jgi:hypothetical protein
VPNAARSVDVTLVPGGAIATDDIDMIAAALRADSADLEVFLEVTAAKFEDALPDHTTVKRYGWLHARRGKVERLDITIEEWTYALARAHHGVRGYLTHVVHGIKLATNEVDPDEWLRALSAALARFADGQARGRAALERLLR